MQNFNKVYRGTFGHGALNPSSASNHNRSTKTAAAGHKVKKYTAPHFRLEREIKVFCWHVRGVIAKAEKRDELFPILLRARDEGETDARDIAHHLFFDGTARKVVAERLLTIAENYGLLEQKSSPTKKSYRSYGLTDAGIKAIEEEQILVPEEGTWVLWACKDPLLPYKILRIAPWKEPAAQLEVWGNKDKKQREFKNVPAWLLNEQGVAEIPAAMDGCKIRIDRIDAKAEAIEAKASLRAVWDITKNRLRIQGKLDGQAVNTALEAPHIAPYAAWEQVLKSEDIWDQWDQQDEVLRIKFNDSFDAERESMKRNLEIKRPSINAFGGFDPLQITGVPLRPSTKLGAGQWAEWRLRQRVREYATDKRFAEWSNEAVTPFDEFEPTVPARYELACEEWKAHQKTQTGRPSTTAWHLMAAEDWEL